MTKRLDAKITCIIVIATQLAEDTVPFRRHYLPDWRQPLPDWRHPLPDWRYPIPDWIHRLPNWRHPPPDWRQPLPDWRHPLPDWRHPYLAEDTPLTWLYMISHLSSRSIPRSFVSSLSVRGNIASCADETFHQLMSAQYTVHDVCTECTFFRHILHTNVVKSRPQQRPEHRDHNIETTT